MPNTKPMPTDTPKATAIDVNVTTVDQPVAFAMASDKLSEGIRLFAADAIKLERLVEGLRA